MRENNDHLFGCGLVDQLLFLRKVYEVIRCANKEIEKSFSLKGKNYIRGSMLRKTGPTSTRQIQSSLLRQILS